MKPVRLLRLLVLGACSLLPWLAHAQYNPYSVPIDSRSQFYLGASVGSSLPGDYSGRLSDWLSGAYNATTTLAPGDYIATSTSQDRTAFGGRLFGGLWVTPNFGLEAGYTGLGHIHWSARSLDTTGSFDVTDSGSVRPHAWYEAVLIATNRNGLRWFGKVGAYQASTTLEVSSLDNLSGASFGVSESIRNSGTLVGLGVSTPLGGHAALRMEAEDYLGVGRSDTPDIPPWHGNIVLLSVGYVQVF